MPAKNVAITLTDPDYLPIVKDNITFYGGSQMWFSDKNRYSKDYILHNYGCGTIATADMFLYLARQDVTMQTPVTEKVIKGKEAINYSDYDPYVRLINDKYTKTKRLIAVLGTTVASAINTYSDQYGLGLKAAWKMTLSYYDMLELIEEMLSKDIPVILAIGPNTPNLWGKKGIPFYELREIDYQEPDSTGKEGSKPYYYKAVQQDINGHFVTVTGVIKDDITGRIMLCISSWGRKYYINYEEYRDYIDSAGGTVTSSIVYVTRNYFKKKVR